MKLFAFLMLLCLSSTLTAQDLTYDMVQKTTQKTPITFANYTTSTGYTFRVGQQITIGKPAHGVNFSYVFIGDGEVTAFTNVGPRAAGDVLTIKSIEVYGSPGYGFHAHIRTGKYGIQIEDAIRVGEVVVGR